MNKNVIILCFSILCATTAWSQSDVDAKNLVTNPGFELTSKGKVKKLKEIKIAADWESPTGLQADLFETGAPTQAGVPSNNYGKEEPFEGSRYAGIVAYSYNNKEPRSYLQTKLLAPLTKDVTYCVKFHISLSDLSKYAINNLGFYMSDEKLELDTKEDIIFDKEKDLKKIVLDPENRIFNARYNWEPVCNTYKSSGKEEYLVIGNFYNNKDTKFEKLKKRPETTGSEVPVAYYYIDQVEVFLLEDASECDCSNKMNAESSEQHVIYHKDYTSEDGFSVEDQVKLATIYFDVLSAEVDKMMEKDIVNLANVMKNNPDLKIKVQGHAERTEISEAAKDYDNESIKNIAKKRAESVADALVKQGVKKENLQIEFFDANEPASDDFSNLGKAKNRRVEFKIAK